MADNKQTKGILREFDLVIYPVKLVIAIGDIEKQVNIKYRPYDTAYNYLAPPEPPTAASVYKIRNKKTRDVSCMIWFPNPEDCVGSYMAHECGHVALEIFNYIGAHIDYEDQEPFCYLLGTIMRFLNMTVYEYQEANPKASKRKTTKIK